jgi:hypothetical protein
MNGGYNMKISQLKYILFLIIPVLFYLQGCSSVTTSNPLIGKTTIESWKSSKYWNENIYFQYDPNTQNIELFKKFYKQDTFKIIIFASIFCDECVANIPQLAKILEASRFPSESLYLFGLDEYSTEPSGFYKKFKIEHTPELYLEFSDGKIERIIKGQDWLESINYLLTKRTINKSIEK